MKKVYIIGSMVFDSPTTQVEKFRFALLPNNSAKEIKTATLELKDKGMKKKNKK